MPLWCRVSYLVLPFPRTARREGLTAGRTRETSCASRVFASRMRWKGTTGRGGSASRASAPSAKFACPTRSTGLSSVVRWVIASPLCVVILRSNWCVPVSYSWMSPAAVPASKRLDVSERQSDVSGCLFSSAENELLLNRIQDFYNIPNRN